MQHYVDNRLTTDVEIIEANSPDVLTDLGVLMHVMVKRHWRGGGKGWTDVPVDWLASASHMGFKRVKESCDRLVEWGILSPSKLNGIPGHVTMYRYDLRAVKEEVYDKLVTSEEEEELDWEATQIEPKLEQGADAPYGTAYVFDTNSWTMQPIKVSPDELLTYPRCRTCGLCFHPTEGRGEHEDECAYCTLKAKIRTKFEPGGKDFYVQSPYGKRTFTQVEAAKILA